jgi:hypothetical protein
VEESTKNLRQHRIAASRVELRKRIVRRSKEIDSLSRNNPFIYTMDRLENLRFLSSLDGVSPHSQRISPLLAVVNELASGGSGGTIPAVPGLPSTGSSW